VKFPFIVVIVDGFLIAPDIDRLKFAGPEHYEALHIPLNVIIA
jgi:hypothetical protein